jgi:hypothetical protein
MEFDRPVLELLHDPRGVFCGDSLLFLEVFKKVRATFLGDYIGRITSAALEIVIREKAGLDTTPAGRRRGYQRGDRSEGYQRRGNRSERFT